MKTIDRVVIYLARYFMGEPFSTSIVMAIIVGGATNSLMGLVIGFFISQLISRLLFLKWPLKGGAEK